MNVKNLSAETVIIAAVSLGVALANAASIEADRGTALYLYTVLPDGLLLIIIEVLLVMCSLLMILLASLPTPMHPLVYLTLCLPLAFFASTAVFYALVFSHNYSPTSFIFGFFMLLTLIIKRKIDGRYQ